MTECSCDERLLKDGRHAVKALVEAVRDSNLTVVETCYKEFEQDGNVAGITVAILLLESHLIIHSWPERENTVIADISVCNYTQDNSTKAKQLHQNLLNIFSPKKKLVQIQFNPILTERFRCPGLDLESMPILDIERILVQKRSNYQEIEVVESNNFGNVLILDSIFQTSEKDEFFYHEALVHVPMITHDNPSEVLIIGGGDGGSAKEVLKYSCVKSCSLVEIDGDVIETSRKYLSRIHQNCFEDKRLKIFLEDGYDFIMKTERHYDVIILDLTDPMGSSLPLYSDDFYSAVKDKLNLGGLVSLQFGSVTCNISESTSIYSSLKRIFPKVIPYLHYVPIYGGIIGFALCGNFFDILSKEEIANRITKRKLSDLKLMNPEVYHGLFAIPNFIKQTFNSPST
jgi:spermidine synthase